MNAPAASAHWTGADCDPRFRETLNQAQG